MHHFRFLVIASSVLIGCNLLAMAEKLPVADTQTVVETPVEPTQVNANSDVAPVTAPSCDEAKVTNSDGTVAGHVITFGSSSSDADSAYASGGKAKCYCDNTKSCGLGGVDSGTPTCASTTPTTLPGSDVTCASLKVKCKCNFFGACDPYQ